MRFRPQHKLAAQVERQSRTLRIVGSVTALPTGGVSTLAAFVWALLGSLALASLIAYGGASAFPVACAVTGCSMVLVFSTLAPAAVAVVVLGLSLVQPLVAAAVLLIGLVALAARKTAALHPVVLLGAPAALYLLIGGPNISTYRGEIHEHTLRFILWHILALLGGAAVAAGLRRRDPIRAGGSQIDSPLIALAFVPGLIGFVWFSAKLGAEVLHPSNRYQAGGAALLLMESLTAGLAVYCYSVFSVRRAHGRDAFVFFVILAALSNSGYRGWSIIGITLIVFMGHYYNRHRVTRMRLLALAAIVVVILSGFQEIRRANNPVGFSSSMATQKYGAQRIPPGFRDVHFSLRESIALTQRLIDARNKGVHLHDSLLLADFKTALPGKQRSGGDIIGDLVGRQGGGGLTPGAVGAAYMDLGYGSLALFFVLGLLVGWVWRRMELASHWAPVYFFAVIYALHFLHRGIPKLSYLVIPLVVLVVVELNGRVLSRRLEPLGRSCRRTLPPQTIVASNPGRILRTIDGR